MNITISELQRYDVPLFHSVFTEVLRTEFPGYTPKVIEYFTKTIYNLSGFYYWLDNKQKVIFVAKNEHTIIGFAIIDIPYGGVSLCRWLGIQKNYQRQGIGSQLIYAWIEYAKKAECHKIELAAQPEAKTFYEKIGLDLEGTRLKSYFGIDQYIFGKIIGEPSEVVMTK